MAFGPGNLMLSDAMQPAPLKTAGHHAALDENFRKVLGIDFFAGSSKEAVARMKHGGLLVVPSAPALMELSTNIGYRDALLNADLCITDSAYMILIWNTLQRDHLHRLSGLEYLRELLEDPEFREPGNTLWIMANADSKKLNLAYLASKGIQVPDDAVHVAPIYCSEIEDSALLERVGALRPRHIVVTLGGGTQERLGLYLKRNLDYLPSIHCIGAAIAFLSGDQVNIPVLADFFYLGWLFRCFSQPGRFVPRYWDSRRLLSMIARYRSQLPPLDTSS